jgi:hypothetical protein
MRMANRRAINSERKGVRYRSRPILEKAKSFQRAKALFKAVIWQRQQETLSHSHKPSHPKEQDQEQKASFKGSRKAKTAGNP